MVKHLRIFPYSPELSPTPSPGFHLHPSHWRVWKRGKQRAFELGGSQETKDTVTLQKTRELSNCTQRRLAAETPLSTPTALFLVAEDWQQELFLPKKAEHVSLCLVAQPCPTLCDPMDFSPPGSSGHGIPQVRTLEWVATPFSRGIFPTQGSNPCLLHCRQLFYCLSHQGSPRILEWVAYPFSRVSSLFRNQTGVSCIAGGFFTSWATREAFL